MKKNTLILFSFALIVSLLNYFNVNAKLFFIFTIGLFIVCDTLIKKSITRQLKEENEKDYLTTLENKRAYSQMKQYFNSCDSIGAIFLDINNLKKTNDIYGHLAGDELIVSVSKVIKKYTKNNVYSYRFGGDEFVMIFTNVMKEQFLNFKKTLIADFSKVKLKFSPYEISVAIGECYKESQIDIEEILQEADCDMYEMKRRMKNEGKND